MIRRIISLFLALLLTNVASASWAAVEQRLGMHFDIRPASLAVAKEGSLLIADEVGKTVWRIASAGKKLASPRPRLTALRSAT